MNAPSAIFVDLAPRAAIAPPHHIAPARAARRVPATWMFLKRASDVIVSAVLLVVLAPVFAVIALAVKLSSPGSVIFSQMRVGKDGKAFRFYKFRTMVDGAHLLHDHVTHLNQCDGPALKIANDPRLHGLGPYLRRTSLDELPQLWNVLCGEMSLVGPRPALPNEVANYAAPYFERFEVMPGLTGLWQVSGRSNVPFRRWMAMDIWYVRNWTPLVDIWLLARTVPAVLFREGAW
ncbi:MAG TPA: sugar transferase [Candidatus Eremiobacteraceae bacterium]|nr:sugar transferase [Candidatus Eremiobacteraceae bacterium]